MTLYIFHNACSHRILRQGVGIVFQLLNYGPTFVWLTYWDCIPRGDPLIWSLYKSPQSNERPPVVLFKPARNQLKLRVAALKEDRKTSMYTDSSIRISATSDRTATGTAKSIGDTTTQCRLNKRKQVRLSWYVLEKMLNPCFVIVRRGHMKPRLFNSILQTT